MKQLNYILLFLCCATFVQAKPHVPDSVMHSDGLYVDHMKIYNDSAVFQGVNLKFDLFNTCYYAAKSKGTFQTYEIALNIRLKQRFYPTIELGYAGGKMNAANSLWEGKGAWTDVGLDFNGLKKNINSLDALLVGARIGTSVQKYNLNNVPMEDSYWKEAQSINFTNLWRTECWGELMAGCQVHVYSGLVMGWNIRLKLLFTRKTVQGEPFPYFIPGFGYRDNTQWGLSYYIGWKF